MIIWHSICNADALKLTVRKQQQKKQGALSNPHSRVAASVKLCQTPPWNQLLQNEWFFPQNTGKSSQKAAYVLFSSITDFCWDEFMHVDSVCWLGPCDSVEMVDLEFEFVVSTGAEWTVELNSGKFLEMKPVVTVFADCILDNWFVIYSIKHQIIIKTFIYICQSSKRCL